MVIISTHGDKYMKVVLDKLMHIFPHSIVYLKSCQFWMIRNGFLYSGNYIHNMFFKQQHAQNIPTFDLILTKVVAFFWVCLMDGRSKHHHYSNYKYKAKKGNSSRIINIMRSRAFIRSEDFKGSFYIIIDTRCNSGMKKQVCR